MASDGDLLPSDARNSQGVPTSAGRDQEEADAERSAMLARASTSLELQCNAVVWYLKVECSGNAGAHRLPTSHCKQHRSQQKRWVA